MARTGKYTHGKSSGTSDRQSSRRTSAAPGETGGVIKNFRMSGPGESQKIRTNSQDYFQSQPLSVPSAIQIPDALEIPDDSQNLRNLADAFGEVNTRLQSFLGEIPKYEKSLDSIAREKAEIKALTEDSNVQLNKAKGILESKAEKDPEAANSYGLFASMDQRVEREYAIVKAKHQVRDRITNFQNLADEAYQASFGDETRVDELGDIIPLNPSTPEWTKWATDQFKDINPQARLELANEINAAIYNTRRSLSTQHAKYKDDKGYESIKMLYADTLSDAKNASLGKISGGTDIAGRDDDDPNFSGVHFAYTNNFNHAYLVSGMSNKKYREITEPTKFLSDIAETVGLVANDSSEINDLSDRAWTMILNTRIGAGKGQLLTDRFDKHVLKRMWDNATSEIVLESARVNDAAEAEKASKAGDTIATDIVNKAKDSNWATDEIDSYTSSMNHTYKVGEKEHLIQAGINSNNLQAVLNEFATKKREAYKLYETEHERRAHIQSLNEAQDKWMEVVGIQEQNENEEWLRNRIYTSNNPIQTKSLIHYFANEGWINSTQKSFLIQDETLRTDITERRASFDARMKDSYVALEGRLKILMSEKNAKITGGSKDTDPRNWESTIQQEFTERIDEFKKFANDTYGAANELSYGERIKIIKDREIKLLGAGTSTGEIDGEIEKVRTGKWTPPTQETTTPPTQETTTENLSGSFTKQIEEETKTTISKEEYNELPISERNQYAPVPRETSEPGKGWIKAYELKPVKPITPKKYIQELGGLKGRGNDQFNADLKTEVTTTPIYDADVFTQELEALEQLANEDRDGSLNWKEIATPLNYRWRNIGFESIDKILRVTGLTPKEYFLAQAKAHGADEDTINRTTELLDKLFIPPSTNLEKTINKTEYNKLNADDKKRYAPVPRETSEPGKGWIKAYELKDEKKDNNQASSILDRGTLIAGDLQPGMLPPINNIKEVPSNLKGQQEAAFDRVWEKNTPLPQRQTEFGNALYKAGFTNEEELTTMLAIAMAESHTRSIRNHTSLNDTDESYGVLQINMLDTGATPNLGKWREEKWSWLNGRNNLFDINMNAKAAYDIVKNEPWLNDNKEGLFNAWASYEDKLHLPFMDEARKRAKEIILNQNKPRYDESSTIGGRSDIA
tara:strand:+ start:3262 stop:6687 length:3426 start_codon:yes stop_codon:yes gene_type:complete